MIVKIVKFQSSSVNKNVKSLMSAGYYSFRVSLPKEVIEMLGSEIHIRKLESHYELSRFGQVQEGKPSKIKKNNSLTMPANLVQEHEDLGEYDIDLDFENECVNMVRK